MSEPTDSPVDEQLVEAVLIVAFKDAGAFRQFIFDDLASRSPVIKRAIAVYERLHRTALGTAFVSAYGIKSFLGVREPTATPADGTVRIIGSVAYRNEHRQLDWVEQAVPELTLDRTRLTAWAAIEPGTLRALVRQLRRPRELKALWQLIDGYSRQGNFLIAARVASTVGYYQRYRTLLEDHRPAGTVVSSDSNPYAMGLTFAARAQGIPTAYITHGHLPDGPPPLTMFDLSILDGPACRAVYEDAGPVRGAVVYRGSEGSYRPLRTAGLRKNRPVIGVFCSLVVDWERLGRLVGELQERLDPSRIVLRLHPNKIIRDPKCLDYIDDMSRVEVSDGDTVLTGDAERCDVVFVGNSSCHLTVLKYGVPTVYVRGLDKVPHDFYRLLSLNVVPAYESVESVDLNAVADFYEAPDWSARFAFFDASYETGVDHFDSEVRDALLELVDRS